MRKIIYNKFDKKSIAQLPTVTFPGKTVVVMSESEAEKAVHFLLSQDILGVDTETRPSFKKGETHMVSLLQVSTSDVCFLFRLNHIGITPAILRLLENKAVPMVGLSLHDDMLSLHKRVAFTPGFFIDLQDLVGELGIEDLSLQKLYANLFHQKISKRQKRTQQFKNNIKLGFGCSERQTEGLCRTRRMGLHQLIQGNLTPKTKWRLRIGD